jgi:hypothetical protein
MGSLVSCSFAKNLDLLGIMGGQAVAGSAPACLPVKEPMEGWQQESKQAGTTAHRSLSTSQAREVHQHVAVVVVVVAVVAVVVVVVVVVAVAAAVQRSPDASQADSRDRR